MKIQHVLTAATLVALSGLAQAQVDPLHVRSWAASCAACHGTNGYAEPGMISLAGVHQLSKGYSDEQIAAIAGYFAAQKK